MTKSFKQSSRSLGPAGAPASFGPDFFDLLAGAARPAEVPVAEASDPATPTGETGPASVAPAPVAKPVPARRKAQPSGNTPLPAPPALPKPTLIKPVPGRDTRQTFVIGENYVEGLRNYVHARRAAGEYDYSQKQALQEAIGEFLAARRPAPPRPEAVRVREQQFRERIREGRQGGGSTGAGE